MRKVLTIFFAFFVLFLGAQNLYAQDNAYKNNLLKIEISKVDETHYNIGLYTQKVYNEPVKVIQKSDNIYYFLLPETNNSITSVPSVGDVTNVIVKSYPYAGQDVNNGYTKVALMTTKPINFTTVLRVADTSVSPRLDPMRLARLDNVFERYAEKLAQNNIPSPLNQFIKAAAPKTETTKVASANAGSASKSLEEYQNKSNKEQAQKKAQPAVKSLQAPVQTQSVKPQQKAQTQVKPQAHLKEQTQAKAQPQTQAKPQIKQQINQASKPVEKVKKEQVPVTQKIAQANIETKAQKQEAQTAEKKIEKPQPEKKPQAVRTKQSAADIKPEGKINEQKYNQIKEFEKQLATTEPVNIEFNKAQNKDEAKNIEATIPNQKEQNVQTVNQPNRNKKLLELFIYVFVFAGLFAMYKNVKNKRLAAAKQNVQFDQNEGMKELLKRVQPKTLHEGEDQNEQIKETEQSDEQPLVSVDEISVSQISDEEAEKIEAFNNYMDSIQEDAESEPSVAITPETEDDVVINELYKPIETPVYNEYDEPASYNEDAAEEADDNDVATIVSSSKLTETRGLYLAKFDGSTSLVGYIQDDIYVLYNFGDVEVTETSIESNLAEENDTDSLYIVKTGGKKLMVKSTPYDMSLEMVM